jgi:AraC-like DNA-binding protein
VDPWRAGAPCGARPRPRPSDAGSAFAARFTRLVGQPVYRYLALMLESGEEAIAQIATRVGYETTTAFSKAFKQHYSFSPGRYRARNGTGPQSSPHL